MTKPHHLDEGPLYPMSCDCKCFVLFLAMLWVGLQCVFPGGTHLTLHVDATFFFSFWIPINRYFGRLAPVAKLINHINLTL